MAAWREAACGVRCARSQDSPAAPAQESADASKRKDEAALRGIVAAAAAAGCEVAYVDKHHLNLLTDNRTHQGVVLDTDPLDFVPLKVLPVAGSPAPGHGHPLWVALDEVSDPQAREGNNVFPLTFSQRRYLRSPPAPQPLLPLFPHCPSGPVSPKCFFCLIARPIPELTPLTP